MKSVSFYTLNEAQQNHAIQIYKNIRQSEIQDELGSNVDIETMLNKEVADGRHAETLLFEVTSDTTVFAHFS